MGAGQSSAGEQGTGLRDLENKIRGSGDLEILEQAFQSLAISSTELDKNEQITVTSLEECFGLAPLSIQNDSNSRISKFMDHVGPAIVGVCFIIRNEKIGWTQILEGYQKCVQASAVEHLKVLFSIFFRASQLEDKDLKLKEEKSDNQSEGRDEDSMSETQLQDFLHFCWLLMCHTRLPNKGDYTQRGPKLLVSLPRIDALLSGAFNACGKKPESEQTEQFGSETGIPVSEISSWIFVTIPGLADCLVRYVRAQLSRRQVLSKVIADEKPNNTPTSQGAQSEEAGKSQEKEEEVLSKADAVLLHRGTAWAVGLSSRDSSAAEILYRASCGLVESADFELPTPLYISSTNGRGLNRFWNCVQGYRAPVLLLISAQTVEESSPGTVFVFGALILNGFENKESSYGSSGSCLFSVDPLFNPFRASGKDKYFIYSHKHTAGVVYRSQPANEGVGFGGSYGKERVWLDQDFATLTVRHHAVDKTYHSGGLVPGQGFSPLKSQVLDIEIWGLGGDKAEQDHNNYLKRENLFSEQRRKVDLAAFGDWEDSPEKMMMNMMANPNAGQRQER